VASVFDVVHDSGGTTAIFASKAKFLLFSRTWNAHGAADRTGTDNGSAKIDRITIDKDNARLVSELNAELRTKPRQFTFLHISLPDDAGHRNGFMGSEYLTAVRHTDELLESILSTIDGRPTLKQQLLVVLTADHGGDGGSHATATKLPNMRVPFMVWGPGVAAGRDLHSLNATFRSPGDGRPRYTGQQPIRNADVANLVTDVLDLRWVPGSELDIPRTLTVFGP
jgi:predicted AlkP superfamily pyrophosphatase or phosphodiesterase